MLAGSRRVLVTRSGMRDWNLVLVVDDDPSMLRSVARLLRQSGYASLLFPSAEAFANQNDFDGALCVVLDINLGDGSMGIELRHRLKAVGSSVPVIYMTGNDTPAVREAALRTRMHRLSPQSRFPRGR